MPQQLSAYYAHHPFTKVADLKPVFTTIRKTVKEMTTPAALIGVASGVAGGAYIGNKAFNVEQEPENGRIVTEYLGPNIPPVKALPEYNDREFVQPINQKQVL